MLSVGLHYRPVGRPGRAASLGRFIDYVLDHDRVWTPTRLDIARHWIRKHPPNGGWKPSRLTRTVFVERFGGVYEHSPWIAEAAFDAGLTAEADSAEGLTKAMAAAASKGTNDQKRALFLAHPDLAGKLALAGTLTAESTQEQAGAGLDRLRADELAKFTALNDAYRARFGIPFIMAIKGRNKAEILAAFEKRLFNGPEAEMATALAEIDRIATLRVKESVLNAVARVVRGQILRFRDDPAEAGPSAHLYMEKGAVLVANGRIEEVGEAGEVLSRRARRRGDGRSRGLPRHAGLRRRAYPLSANPGDRLLRGAVARLAAQLHVRRGAEVRRSGPLPPDRGILSGRDVRCGTTTAMVYCTVHPQSVDAFFAAAERRGARMIAGKTMMDRDAPEALTDTAQRGYNESKALIERWTQRGRLGYAVTPRFAVTSSQAQLEAAGALAANIPGSMFRRISTRTEPRSISSPSFSRDADLSRGL